MYVWEFVEPYVDQSPPDYLNTMKRSIGLAILLLFTIFNISANVPFVKYNVDNVLCSNLVNAIEQDENGLIWVGTSDGLISMHSTRSWHYMFSDSNPELHKRDCVRSLVYSPDEHLMWVGTDDGLFRFYLSDCHFERFDLVANDGSSVEGRVVALARNDDGAVWIKTESNGVFCYRPVDRSLLYFAAGDNIDMSGNSGDIAVLRGDELWCTTRSGGICSIDLRRKRFDFRSFAASNLPSTEVKSLAANRRGNKLWIGTSDRGLYCFDLHSGRFSCCEPPQNNIININAIVENDSNDIIMGCDNGLWLFDQQNDRFERIDSSAAPSRIHIVSDLLFDREEGLWVATRYTGVSYFVPSFRAIELYHTAQTLLDDPTGRRVKCIEPATDGNVWLGTSFGLN